MIITTRRAPRILILDIILTSTAWIAFIYLFTDGVVFLLSEPNSRALPYLFGLALSPSATTLLLCALVCLFNATVVYLWARSHRFGAKVCQTTHPGNDLTIDVVAEHFALSPHQLGDVRDSRITIFYHSPSGGITRLETEHAHPTASAHALETDDRPPFAPISNEPDVARLRVA